MLTATPRPSPLRFKRGGPYLPGQSTITLHPDRLDQPSRWQRPRRVFVCSMSDLFHEQVPFAFIDRIVREMESARQHTFQVLTKRPERMLEYLAWPDSFLGFSTWPSHIWLGVSVENQYWADRRIPLLMQAIPRVRWLSVEPLLKAVDLTLYLEEIDWVVVGGESGPRARPIEPEWVQRIRDDCLAAKTPFFFKQWGGRTAKAGGRELDGRTWDEYPA